MPTRARRIVEVTGPEDIIVGDANCGWRLNDAIIAARAMEDLPRFYFEQPCPTMEECIEVRRHTTLPMVYDEVVSDPATLLRAAREGGAGAFNLKVSKVGGLTKAKLMRDLGQELGLQITVEDTWGGDIVSATVGPHRCLHETASAAQRVLHERLDQRTRRRISAAQQERLRRGADHARPRDHRRFRHARRAAIQRRRLNSSHRWRIRHPPEPRGQVGISPMSRKPIDIAQYVDGIRAGNRAMLARAITLVESTNPDHQKPAAELLQQLVGDIGKAHRIGITGVPGVGKSTTIDQFGINLVEAGHKVAVLAVDPTSTRSGGSILGDKTRMSRLAVHPDAFVRPSPTSGTLGGVAKKTRETMSLVEAAGFDIVIVETVGVGQSEVTVAGMVDIFLVLLLPGGGDELQGIKKGIIEIADLIAINKADGDNRQRAERSASEYRAALSLLTPTSANWRPPVVAISGLTNYGLDALWEQVRSHRDRLTATGEFQARRKDQAVRWMHDMIANEFHRMMSSNKKIAAALTAAEQEVRAGTLAPTAAVSQIMDLLVASIAAPS